MGLRVLSVGSLEDCGAEVPPGEGTLRLRTKASASEVHGLAPLPPRHRWPSRCPNTDSSLWTASPALFLKDGIVRKFLLCFLFLLNVSFLVPLCGFEVVKAIQKLV